MRKKASPAFRSGKSLEKHHVIPKSRGGAIVGKNVIIIQRRFHQSWHHLFSNLTPAEAILHILRNWNVGSIVDELTIESIIRMVGGRKYGSEVEKD